MSINESEEDFSFGMKSFVEHDVSLTKDTESNNSDSEISEEDIQHSDGSDDEGCGSSVEEVRINQEGRESDESSESDLFEMIAARREESLMMTMMKMMMTVK